MNVQLRSVINNSNFRCSNAFVQTTIFSLSGRDVQVWKNVAIWSHVLSDLESFRVCDFLSVQFPWNFGCWVSAGNALDENWISWVENFFGESLSDDWWIDFGFRRIKNQFIWHLITTIVIKHLHRPPNLSSAVACALSWSFLMTHWYMPLSSFFTEGMVKMASVWSINFPSFIHRMVLIGFPEKRQVKTAGLPKSMVWTCGSIEAERGAVTVKTVSTLSPPTELFTTQRYFPESSTAAFLMIKVPDTCLIRSPSGTGDLRSDPSMNLYHLCENDMN